MRHLPHARRGILATEVMVSFSILAMLAILAVDICSGYRRTSDRYDWRRAAAWAAEAQWARYQAGAALDSSPPDGMLPEEIRLKTTARAGSGQWAGFQLVTVRATAKVSMGGEVTEQVGGYLREEARR
jgi:hypothetical protein